MSDVPEGSQRSKTIALGLLVLVAVAIALLVVRSSRPKPTQPVASASAKPAPAPAPSASVAPPAEAALDAIPDLEGAYVGYDTLADGTKAPKLPDSAPQSVTFGVVVFSYAGAELAPASARTKEQAREKATAMIAEAKRDFSAAVAKGDRGSSANLGRLPRGMLEPAAEYVLFTLPKGEVASAPVDTPRGFWIVRRID